MLGFRRGDPVPPPPEWPQGSAAALLVSQLTSLLDASCPQWRSAAAEYAERCSNVHDSGYDKRDVPYRKEDRKKIVAWIEANPEVLLLLALELNAGAERSDPSAVVAALASTAGLTQPHLRLALGPGPDWSETLELHWRETAYNEFGINTTPDREMIDHPLSRPMSLSEQLRANARTVVSAVVEHDLATGAVGPLAPARVDLVSGVSEAVVLLSAEEVLLRAARGPLDAGTRESLEASREVLSGRIAEAAQGLRAAVERHRELQGEFVRLRSAADAEHAASLRDAAAEEAVARVSAILGQPALPAARVRIQPASRSEPLGH